jgi:carboxyl-terminal processing protease
MPRMEKPLIMTGALDDKSTRSRFSAGESPEVSARACWDRLSWRSAQLCAGLVLVFAMPLVHSEELQPRVREQTYVMLRDVKKAIEQNYYDPTFGGVDLGAKAELARVRIAKATSIGEAFAAIAQFELELDDSHTFFIPPRLNMEVDYGWAMRPIEDKCYVVRVSPKSDAARQGVSRGAIVRSVNGFQPGRDNLWRLEYLFNVLRPQPGLHVELVIPSGTERALELAAEVRKQKRTLDLTGRSDSGDITRVIEEAEKQKEKRRPTAVKLDEVLILRLPSFYVDKSVIDWNLRRARDHSALIVDLRGNSGGPVEILQQFLGGLASADVSIGLKRERNRSEALVAQGARGSAFVGRLLVLVDSESASASELFARTIQLTHRGTIVGERTAGAVMVSRLWPLRVSNGENVILYGSAITVADLIMSDGARLEKAGVVPDVTVFPTGEDLAAGRDPALARALALAGKAMDAAAAGALLPN